MASVDELPVFDFDPLRMYFGEDYHIGDIVTIHMPTIGEIIEHGEQRMFSSITPFTGNPTSYRVQLWDMGVDWNEISDFELFAMLSQGLTQENTSLLFGDLDFSKLQPYENKNDGSLILVSSENPNFQVDEILYLHMREYIRKMFNQYPKVEKAKGKLTKQSMIDEDKMNARNQERLNSGKSKNTSFLLPLVSALCNHPGFKYKKTELKEIGIFEFMDSVQRLQIYENTMALMSGMYSGMLDTSKMDLKTELNWMRDLQ